VDKAWLPAVVTMGVRETAQHSSRVWAELVSGAVVHVVDKRTGRTRGWVVPEPEDGSQPERIGCQELATRFGFYLEQVRDGYVFEIFDRNADTVRGYLQWAPPDPIARIDAALQFASRRTRYGPGRMRSVWPAETVARA